MRRRSQIGIPHAEIDYVFAAMTRFHFQPVNNAEDVRRQSFDSLKLHSGLPQTSKTTIYKPSALAAQLEVLGAEAGGRRLVSLPRPVPDARPNDGTKSVSLLPMLRF